MTRSVKILPVRMQLTTAAAVWLLALALPAQTSKPAKLNDWPKLTQKQQDRLQEILKNLNQKNDALHAANRDELVEMGAGVVPTLLSRLTDNATNFNDKLVPTLERIVRPEHAALLARSSGDPKLAVRRFVFDRLPRFCDREMAPIFQKGLKDKDPEVQFLAALGLLAIEDVASGDLVLARCNTEWADNAVRIEAVLRPARGDTCTKWALGKLSAAQKNGEKGAQVATLRVLRYVCTKEAAGALKWGLDSEDHLVKKETINALRAIVDGAAPLEELSVFQAIEAAKEWKGRV